jgi:RNA polymerase sigma factor (sigma-70 family)
MRPHPPLPYARSVRAAILSGYRSGPNLPKTELVVANPLLGRASIEAGGLYERHARTIYAHCLSRLGNREDAEDALQATFLNAFRGVRRGVIPELELAWLYAIANRVIANRRRAEMRRRRVETPCDLDELQDVLASPQRESVELIRLAESLEAMPEQQRRALLLREWQGLSCREIAEELELTPGAVEALLFRARRTLQRELTRPRRFARLRGIQLGSLLLRLKSIFGASTAAKLVATAIAVVGAVGAGTSAPPPRQAVRRPVAVRPPAVHRPVQARVLRASAPVARDVIAPAPLEPATQPAVPSMTPSPAQPDPSVPAADPPEPDATIPVREPQHVDPAAPPADATEAAPSADSAPEQDPPGLAVAAAAPAGSDRPADAGPPASPPGLAVAAAASAGSDRPADADPPADPPGLAVGTAAGSGSNGPSITPADGAGSAAADTHAQAHDTPPVDASPTPTPAAATPSPAASSQAPADPGPPADAGPPAAVPAPAAAAQSPAAAAPPEPAATQAASAPAAIPAPAPAATPAPPAAAPAAAPPDPPAAQAAPAPAASTAATPAATSAPVAALDPQPTPAPAASPPAAAAPPATTTAASPSASSAGASKSSGKSKSH